MTGAPIVSEILGDDPDLMPLVERFVARLPVAVTKIRTQFDAGNWQELREAAHDLKGTSGNLGFPTLMELAHQIEQSAVNQSVDTAAKLIDDLELLLGRVRVQAA